MICLSFILQQIIKKIMFGLLYNCILYVLCCRIVSWDVEIADNRLILCLREEITFARSYLEIVQHLFLIKRLFICTCNLVCLCIFLFAFARSVFEFLFYLYLHLSDFYFPFPIFICICQIFICICRILSVTCLICVWWSGAGLGNTASNGSVGCQRGR